MTYSEALYQFWSSFTDEGAPMDAYLTGHVPDDALYPCVTFENIQGAAFGRIPTVAFVWIQQNPGVSASMVGTHASSDAFFAQIKKAIPESGRVLRYDGGIAVLYRQTDEFLRAYDPPEKDGEVTAFPIRGGRVGYEIAFYGD